uniref:SKA complex subunit 1 n=1 Tax=Gasterosteus aculeatus aculeatus TaxID=481459 RepID=A0AAQ4P9L1_GASAC
MCWSTERTTEAAEGARGVLPEEFAGCPAHTGERTCTHAQEEMSSKVRTRPLCFLLGSFKSNILHLQWLQCVNLRVTTSVKKHKLHPGGGEPVVTQNNDVQPVLSENAKKTTKSFVREMEVITMQEFESIPQYMKGRVPYDQLNAAVQSLNAAVSAKYKILHQSAKSLNNQTRKQRQRFKDQETKETKGHFFVVEDDIREFTRMKADKRFQGILNMLRHSQRLRELRGGGVVRYVLV